MTAVAAVPGIGTRSALDFERRPLLVFWETTRACLLACAHCRASAMSQPLRGELSTEDGLDLIAQVAEFGRPYPILVLTGGDLLMRGDVYELISAASSIGIPTCVSPSVTPLLTRDAVTRIKERGVKAVSISLDGAVPQTHEGIRGVNGHFPRTLEAISWFVEAGLRVQVNTTVMRRNVDELADVASLVGSLGAHMWEVFFLVGVGRGAELAELDAHTNEDVCHFLYDASQHGFVVRTVEAPFFRRVAASRQTGRAQRAQAPTMHEVRAQFGLGETYSRLRTRLDELMGLPQLKPAAHTVSTRDGKGIVFVSHDGEVYPAGFLPRSVGNVKRQRLLELYRGSELMRRIRAGEFAGRCGVCTYNDLCGGSRSRALARSGDPLGEDPGCAFLP
jgi:AdoMet-dependent heme synthase